jgi:hypothetical protein
MDSSKRFRKTQARKKANRRFFVTLTRAPKRAGATTTRMGHRGKFGAYGSRPETPKEGAQVPDPKKPF